MSREDQYAVFVTINGQPIEDTFDTLEGGEFGSDSSTHRPGGLGRQKSYGGPQTVENVTVSRVYELERDYELVKRLRPLRGKAKAVVSKQPLDIDGNKFGSPDPVYTGTLNAVRYPDFDSDSNDPGFFELEFECDG